MPPSGLSLSQIGQFAINIHDLDRAVAFYRDVAACTEVVGASQYRNIGSPFTPSTQGR
jgi:hypothetical protein